MFNSVIDAFKKAEALENRDTFRFRILSKMTKMRIFQFLVFHFLFGFSTQIPDRPDKIQSAEIRQVSFKKYMKGRSKMMKVVI